MHRPYLVRLSEGGSPGHLADFGQAVGQRGINLRAIGGAEWEGSGSIAVLVDDSDEDNLEGYLEQSPFGWTKGDAVEIELSDAPGALGNAARVLADADINITCVLVVGGRGGRSLVVLGVEPGNGDAAHDALGDLTLEHIVCDHHETPPTSSGDTA